MLQHNGKRVVFDGYMTDVLGDQSVQFVADSKEKPFFMYLSYNAVHTPMHAKKEDLEKFKNHPRQKLAAMTWNLDKNIGKLLEKLEELDREAVVILLVYDANIIILIWVVRHFSSLVNFLQKVRVVYLSWGTALFVDK